MEWLPFFTDPDPWQVLVGILVLILGPTALLSEKVVKQKFGAIGAFFRWLSGQKRRQLEEKQTTHDREIADLWAEIKRLDKERTRSDERMARVEQQNSEQHSYIRWVTEIFRNIEIWAAQHGLTLPPPPFKTYPEWKKDREEDNE